MKAKIYNSLNNVVTQIIKSGAVGIIPTDTVYGIVGLLSNPTAIEKLRALKIRPVYQPIGTIIFAKSEQLAPYTHARDLKKAEQFWPGNTSVILDVNDTLQYAAGRAGSLPFRLPKDSVLQAFLNQTGPLAQRVQIFMVKLRQQRLKRRIRYSKKR